jgi:TatD DNase family protein
MGGYIDAHNHLADPQLDESRADILLECVTRRFERLLVNSTHPADWKQIITLAKSHPLVIPHLGVHPWFCDDLPATWSTLLEKYLSDSRSAIGEIGLDGSKASASDPLQEEVFIRQLNMAQARNIPMSLHGTRRWHRLYNIINGEGAPDCGFLLHAFNGDPGIAHKFLDIGGHFSFGPTNLAARNQELLKLLPIERIFLETDCPKQSSARESLNSPLNILSLYDTMSEILGLSREILIEVISNNFNRLYRSLLPQD